MEDFAKENADTRILISDELVRQNRKAGWLAGEAHVSRQLIGMILKFDRNLTQPVLDRINKALNTDFPLRKVKTLNH
jgi:plasmid maintenance system antidote protein VapI